MHHDKGNPPIGPAFHPVNSNITAGNDINVYNSVTVNKVESSVLTRLKTALNPVTGASYDSYEARQRSECFPNTRIQVLKDIEAWINGESDQAPIYVLDGVAGIGKSTIAQTIAVRAAALGLLSASFFFSRDEDLRKVGRYFFPTIAYQLACYDDQFATRISRSLDQHPDAPAKQLHQQLSLLLLKPLRETLSQISRPTLIVIDALDECEEENAEELLTLLGQHMGQLIGLKILITARPEAHIRDILDQDKNHERFRLHEIEDSIVHSDIRLYLQSRLSVEETRKASRNRKTPWQPTAKDMEMLCGICGTLFIIASTATKFILDRKRLNPAKQLSLLLEGVSPSGYVGSKYTNVLDETYLRIIIAAQSELDVSDDDWYRELNNVLGALITVLNPLPCNALASLLDMDPNDVEATLSQLHSLVAPRGSGDYLTFRIHHKSFPDFITDKDRIKRVLEGWKSAIRPDLDTLLWINVGDHHRRLAKACFKIMDRNLKKNMANISEEDWYKDMDDIPHIGPQLISRDLAYASLHWATHLRSAHGLDKDLELQKSLGEWASRHLLAWMEVMIILGRVHEVVMILQAAIESMYIEANAWIEPELVLELLSDACRLIQQGAEVIKISPIHLYQSCLPFIPTETLLSRTYCAMASLTVSIGKGKRWNPLLATLTGHSDSVLAVAFSSDDSRLASGSSDSTIRLWDAQTGAHIHTLIGHLDYVLSVAFSSDGSQLASGSSDRTARLWDAKTGAAIVTLTGHSDIVRSVAFSTDSSRLISGAHDETVRLWDTKTGVHLSTLTGHAGPVLSVAFSSNEYQLASGCSDKTIRLWDTRKNALANILEGHSGVVYSVAFSRDGSLLASGSGDATVRLWNPRTGTHLSTLVGHAFRIPSVLFSNDGTLLASGSYDETVRLWNAETCMHVCTLTTYSRQVGSIAFSNDSRRLVSGTHGGKVQLWNTEFCTDVSDNSDLPRHSGQITCIALSDDGSQLASGSNDQTIQLRDAKAGTHISIFISKLVWSVSLSSDGTLLASGSDDGTVQLWDAKTGSHISTLTGHSDWVKSVSFSKGSQQLASGSYDTTIRLWDAKSGSHLFTLAGHSGAVISVAFSSDNSRLASGSDDTTARLWDAKTGAHLFTFFHRSGSVYSVTFLSDGFRLASRCNEPVIRFWDTRTGAIDCSLITHSDLTTKAITFPGVDSPTADTWPHAKSHLIQYKSTNPMSFLLLAKRKISAITGLIVVKLLPNGKWEAIPICWFPPDLEVTNFASDKSNSRIAIGCTGSRVIMLEFLSAFSALMN